MIVQGPFRDFGPGPPVGGALPICYAMLLLLLLLLRCCCYASAGKMRDGFRTNLPVAGAPRASNPQNKNHVSALRAGNPVLGLAVAQTTCETLYRIMIGALRIDELPAG